MACEWMGLESWISGVRDDRSANCATTTALVVY